MIHALIIAKSLKMMAKMAEDIGNEFDIAYATDLKAATAQYNGADFDIIILVRPLRDADRDQLRRTLFAHNPALVVIKSGGPHGKLVAMQAKAGLNGHHAEGFLLNGLHYANDAVYFKLAHDIRVCVAVYRKVPFFRLQVTTIYDGLLEAGEHRVVIPRKHRGIIGAPFIFVTANETEVHQVAGPF